jgi:sulfur carrier protein
MSLMKILVNGEERTVSDGATVATLMSELGRNVKFCAVERNGELVPRTEHSQCSLADGDQLEIVTLVGGG